MRRRVNLVNCGNHLVLSVPAGDLTGDRGYGFVQPGLKQRFICMATVTSRVELTKLVLPELLQAKTFSFELLDTFEIGRIFQRDR